MIEQLRRDIAELNEDIQEWQGEIEYLEEKIEDARAQISDKEVEIERLENESRRNDVLESLTNALSNLSLEDLHTLSGILQSDDGFNVQNLTQRVYAQNNENRITPTITTDEIDSDDVTFDMLTDEMHNAMITLVGVRWQDLWRVHHRSPEIGDIITLAKRDNIDTQNTVGYTEDGISIGILPAGDDKIAQLERIGANIVHNHQIHLDNPILERKYKVVGVIPSAFIFLDPIYDEAENIEETVAEAVSQLGSERHRLTHNALSIDEARSVFNDEMPDHCRIHNIIEQDDCFIINYENHRANTTAEYYQTVEVERAE